MNQIKAACGCNMGKRRENNEDNFYFNGQLLAQDNVGFHGILTCVSGLDTPACFAVFDGMGGASYGEEAAYLAAKALQAEIRRQEGGSAEALLRRACLRANRNICAAAQSHGGDQMGSTAALLQFSEGTVSVMNIGDSRIFHSHGGKWKQISVDHTDQALLRACGISNRRPRLTQHLGIEPDEMTIEPHFYTCPICSEDYFLLCSDGLTDMVEELEIQRVVQSSHSAEHKVDRLIGLALEAGGKDNITVILCEVS